MIVVFKTFLWKRQKESGGHWTWRSQETCKEKRDKTIRMLCDWTGKEESQKRAVKKKRYRGRNKKDKIEPGHGKRTLDERVYLFCALVLASLEWKEITVDGTAQARSRWRNQYGSFTLEGEVLSTLPEMYRFYVLGGPISNRHTTTDIQTYSNRVSAVAVPWRPNVQLIIFAHRREAIGPKRRNTQSWLSCFVHT